MQIQPTSGAEAAAVIVVALPTVARVELYPQWSDGTGPVVRRQRVTMYDASGRVIGTHLAARLARRAVMAAFADADWDRPQTFDVVSGELSLTFPVVLSLPEALAPAADPYRAAQLDVQRHELEDDAEPPLLSDGDVSTAADYPGWVPPHTDTAVDCARSLAEGHMDPPDWSVCDPQPAAEREAEDVPVIGGAL